jgi:hypothetical protein
MRRYTLGIAATVGVWLGLLALHAPFLKLPYYWDEAGYYVPAALDFFRHWLLIPSSTEPIGHTPLVSVYLGIGWRIFGFSPPVTRAAMILFAAGTIVVTVALARRVLAGRRRAREAALAAGVLLALAPLFFAQSEMVHLDLAVAFFTMVAILGLLDERWILFAAAGSLAVLTKETAVLLVPVAWAYLWIERHRPTRRLAAFAWIATALPCLPLAAWALYYHHHTGFWTGNAGYLQYNLYSTLNPVRFLLSLLRRLYEVFASRFNWLLTALAFAGWWWSKKHPQIAQIPSRQSDANCPPGGGDGRRFTQLTALLAAAYLLMLSAVGGAILPRYMLPIYPPLMIVAVGLIWRLPRRVARAAGLAAAACFVIAWFSNPPYPFPYEDNLAFADFVHLHQQAAEYLEHRDVGGSPEGTGADLRILTAWPATNELETPPLGYVMRPLRVVPVDGFTAADFQAVKPSSFDMLYLYSRKWEPRGNWLDRFPWLIRLQSRYFDYSPQVPEQEIAARFHLKLAARWERRGQWAAIYER